MKKQLSIGFFLMMAFSSPEFFPQEEKQLTEVVIQDDLGTVTDAFQESFFEALKQKAIENHEKAIEALMKCLVIDDSKPVVYLELGKNHNQLKNFDKAATYLELARKAVPDNEAVLAELYETYYLNQEFAKALPIVEELSAIDATFSEDLANLYILNEEYEQALELLDKLDEEWGKSEYRDGLRRQIYTRTDDMSAKVADLERRIKRDPNDEQNYLNLIFVYSENGDINKAFETAKELQAANPSSELVHLALYKFYLDAGNSKSAVESMKILLESREVDEGTKYKVLNDFLLFVAKDPSLEEDLMEIVKVFSLDESNTKVYEQLGTFFLEKKDMKEALKYFELGLENEDSNFPLTVKTMLLQLELGKFTSAETLGEKGIQMYPSQPLLYLLKGTAQNKLMNFMDAEETLRTGLDYLVDDPEMQADFYEQLSIAFTGLEKEKEAAEFREKAAQIKNRPIDEQ